MLTVAVVALLWAASPAVAAPTPQDYDPGKIFNDTDSDFASALNVTANQSQKMLFWLDCPGATSNGEYDYLSVYSQAGMDLSFHVEMDPNATSQFKGYLVSPEYFRLVVATVPPTSGGNDVYFNTTTRVAGNYYFVADGLASCFLATFYNVTWVETPTSAPDDGDNSIAAATPLVNGSVVSGSLMETTDQADFFMVDVVVDPGSTVLFRLSGTSGLAGYQFEIYNTTGVLDIPPSFHGTTNGSTNVNLLSSTGITLTSNTTFIIRLWSNGAAGSYGFTVLLQTYSPFGTNLDFSTAIQLNELQVLQGTLDYTFEKDHYYKIFVGNARTLHVQAWSNTINVGIRLYNEEYGTLAHLPRGLSAHNPVTGQNPADAEVIVYTVTASDLANETGWYYLRVTIWDDLPPQGDYAVAFFFNDGPVGTDDLNATTPEDTPYVGYNVSSRFSDLDCTLDPTSQGCGLTIQMVSNDSSNMTWDFSAAPLLTVTPAANWSGVACADFNVTDGFQQTANARVCFIVTPVNDAPYVVGGPSSDEVPEDSSIVRVVSTWFADVDGNPLTITVSGFTNINVTLALNGQYTEATFTPAPNWNGCENITFTATDNGTPPLSADHTVDVCVIPVNDAPEARGSIPEVDLDEDTTATLDLSAVLINGVTGPAFTDIDGNPLTYVIYDQVNVTVSVAGTVLTITPDPNFSGLASFSVAASDGIAESTHAAVRVRVAPVNDAPTIDSTNPSSSTVTVNEGDSKTFVVTASDIDGNPLTFTWFVDGVGQTNSNDTAFTVDVPITEELSRSEVIRVEVSDGAGGTAETSWTLNIQNTNLAPTVSITTPSAGQTFSTDDDIAFSSTTHDPDGDALTYTWTSDRVGAPIGDQQTFTTKLPAGTHNIRLVVSDGTTTTEANVTIVVNAPQNTNNGPGPEAAAAVGALVAVAVVAAVVGARRRR